MMLIIVFTVYYHFIFCSTFVVQHSVHKKKCLGAESFLAAMLKLARTAVLTFSMNVVISFNINLLLKMCHLHVACESYLKQFVVPYGN